MAKYRKSFVERIKPTGFKDLLRRIVLLICVCVFCHFGYRQRTYYAQRVWTQDPAGGSPCADVGSEFYGQHFDTAAVSRQHGADLYGYGDGRCLC